MGELIPGWRRVWVTGSGGSWSSEGRSALLLCTPEYSRPKPARYSGYHRYQFRLYRQSQHQTISLSSEEQQSLGKDPPGPDPRPEGPFQGCGQRRGLGMPRSVQRDAQRGRGRGVKSLPGGRNPRKTSGNGLASGIGSRERCGL